MEAPAPPPIMIPSDFKSDKIIGVIIMVVATLSALGGIFVLFIGSLVSRAENQTNVFDGNQGVKGASHALQSSQNSQFPDMHLGAIFSTAGWVAIVIAILQFGGGMGVFKSSRKGLIGALAISGVSALGGVFGFIFGVAIGLYVILRLWGNVGPRPV